MCVRAELLVWEECVTEMAQCLLSAHCLFLDNGQIRAEYMHQ